MSTDVVTRDKTIHGMIDNLTNLIDATGDVLLQDHFRVRELGAGQRAELIEQYEAYTRYLAALRKLVPDDSTTT